MKTSVKQRSLYLVIPLVATLLATALPAWATQTGDDEPDATSFPQVEQKVKKLKKRVRQLEADVGELQALNLPVDVDVDCTAGNSINSVLSTHANGLGLLTIRVTGECTEAVNIARSNVALVGASANAALLAPNATSFGVSVQNAARNVTVASLRLAGGQGAAAVTKGARAVFTNVVAEQTNLGMVSVDNGTLDITGSTIRNNSFGVYAARGAVTVVSNSTVENNGTGLLAFKAGSINTTSLGPDGVVVASGVIVRNNTNGGVSRSGGMIELSDTRVENNTSVGLLVDSTSTIHFFNPMNGTGNFITGNPAVGVLVQKNASVVFGDSTSTISGNGVGVLCQPNSSYILPPSGSPGTVINNVSGNIVGCVP